MKFFQVAISTPGTLVVSGDSDFAALRQKIEKGNTPELEGKLRIVSPEEALTIL
jgi:hypothetical protein